MSNQHTPRPLAGLFVPQSNYPIASAEYDLNWKVTGYRCDVYALGGCDASFSTFGRTAEEAESAARKIMDTCNLARA